MICTKIMNVSIYLGSPRTRRALPPSYLSIPGHTECLDSQTLPGDSHSGKCIPAIKPAYCSEAAWADLALDSGLDACYGGIEAYCKICFFLAITVKLGNKEQFDKELFPVTKC